MERQNSGLESSRPYEDFYRRGAPSAAASSLGRGRPRVPPVALAPRAFAGLPLDEALRRYVGALTGAAGERLESLLSRIGWGEEPACTLLEAGDRIGITRERMRQIEADLRSKAARNPIVVVALERALELLGRERLGEPTVTARELVDRGITSVPFRPENVLAAAELFGMVKSGEMESIARRRDEALSRERDLLRLAARIAGKGGLATVARVTAEAVKDDARWTEAAVRSVLSGSSEARFLDADWFFVETAAFERGRFVRALRAMLSVSPVLDVARVHRGLERAYRYSSVELPPAAVVTAFLMTHPAFTVRGDEVTSVEALDWRSELTPTERVFVEVFRASPTGLLRSTQLMRACALRGVRRYLFWMTASSSPILDRFARAAWSLCGAPVTPRALHELEVDARRGKALVAFGRSDRGGPWIEMPVRGVRLRRFPPGIGTEIGGGRFPVFRKGVEAPIGTIRVSKSGSPSGIQPLLRRLGRPERGTLRIVFDLERRAATASLVREQS